MKAEQKYLFLDLEMNQPSGKLIQIGVCIASYSNYKNDSAITLKWYVDPNEPITEFITKLTGITDADIVDSACSAGAIAGSLSSWITKNDTFINPVTWGGGDTSVLLEYFRDNDVEFKHFGRRHVDVKTIYQFHNFAIGKAPTGGLSSAMASISKNKLQFKGIPHRADIDAYNTMRMFFWMMERQSNIEKTIKNIKEL